MSQDDFQFGDKLDFSQTDQPQHGVGSFVILCCKCGGMKAVSGLCLLAGVRPCECEYTNKSNYLF